MMEKKKKHKPPKVTKPYVRGRIVDKTTVPGALKFFFATMGLGLAFLLVGVMMSFENKVLCVIVNSVIALSAYMIFHQSGAGAGADAVNQGEIMYARREKGRPVADWEEKLCFHPLKGLVTALLGSLPLVACSVILACIAQRQVSNLGTLPSWLSGVESRPEIGNALLYYHETGSMSLESVLRLLIRMTTMPFVNMVGPDSKDGMLMLERISPLLNLLPALAYGIGYMSGVQIRTGIHSNIELGKRKAKKKQQKQLKERARQHSGPQQLN